MRKLSSLAKRALLLLILALAADASAGGPEPFEVSLHELLERSDAVILAQPHPPLDGSLTRERGECLENLWQVTVLEVVHLNPRLDGALNPGDDVHFTVNPSWWMDCRFRVDSITGASFAAPYYEGIDPNDPADGPFLVFLQHDDGHWLLAAEDAFEDAAMLPELFQQE